MNARQTTSRAALYDSWRPIAEAMGFKVEGLSFDDLYALYDALRTVSDVLSGLRSQPRFDNEDEHRAGFMLETFADRVNQVRDLIEVEAAQRTAVTSNDLNRQFFLLASPYIDGLSSPATVMKELARIAAGHRRLGWLDIPLDQEGGGQ